jgi:hypothetical protein
VSDLEFQQRVAGVFMAAGPSTVAGAVCNVIEVLIGQGHGPEEIGAFFAEYARFLKGVMDSPEGARIVSANDQLIAKVSDDLGIQGDEGGLGSA